MCAAKQVIEHYDDVVWSAHLQHKAKTEGYNEDLHYPVLLRITRRL